MEGISLTSGQEPAHPLRTIHKYHLMGTQTKLDLPVSAQPLHVGVQDELIMLWVDVPWDAEETVERNFIIYGTGHQQRTDVCHSYVGTVQQVGLVWHVYETHEHDDEFEVTVVSISDFADAVFGGDV